MTNEHATPTNVTALLTFLTLCAKLLFDVFRERRRDRLAERNRQWDIEDRQKSTAGLAAKIDENTDISKNAFEVANHVNEKIVAVHATNSGSNADVLAALADIQKQLSGNKRSGD